MKLNVKNETSTLQVVVLGQPGSIASVITADQTFDAKSYETVMRGAYPLEKDIYSEMSAFEEVLLKYKVEVVRPYTLENCNLVFARDVAFVIDDKIVVSNLIPQRQQEREAYDIIFEKIDYNKIYNLPQNAHVEGGDIVLYNDIIFVGLYTGHDYSKFKTARTNQYALFFLKELFPHKNFIPLELKKHDTDPRKGVLHLDCSFMPVGKDKAILYKEGFLHEKDYYLLLDLFGKNNVFELDQEEMYNLTSNVFSISPQVVVSENRFKRLNAHMEREWGMTVEAVPYLEVSKMGGLLHCSTLPLIRSND